MADVIKGGKKLPSRVVFHGQAGVGKTSFAAHAPSPFFLLSPQETGLHTLIDSGQLPETPNVEVQVWEDVLALTSELTNAEHLYRTLIIDTIDGIAHLNDDHVCRTQFDGDWSEKGFTGYYRGYKVAAAGPWRGFLADLEKLREVKRMSIILLAHTTIGNFKNPEGPDYDRWTPDIYKDAWSLTLAWADIVLFGNRNVVAVKERGERKAKARGEDSRFMLTEWSPAVDAKNRHGLPPRIEMGVSGKEAWDNFIKAMAEGRANSVAGNSSGKEAATNG